jgi:hypothetical protein
MKNRIFSALVTTLLGSVSYGQKGNSKDLHRWSIRIPKTVSLKFAAKHVDLVRLMEVYGWNLETDVTNRAHDEKIDLDFTCFSSAVCELPDFEEFLSPTNEERTE